MAASSEGPPKEVEMGSPSRQSSTSLQADQQDSAYASGTLPLIAGEAHSNGQADVEGQHCSTPTAAGRPQLSVRTTNLRSEAASARLPKGKSVNGYHHIPTVSAASDDEAMLLQHADLRSEDEEPLSPPLPPERRRHPIPDLKRYYMVCIFTLTASLLYADQNLMAPNLTAIAEEFGMTPRERDQYLGGYINGLFFAVGAPSALLLGYLCDKWNRRNLLFVVVLLGEGPCLATYFVRRYWQLLLVRMLTGISLGGTLPLVFSLVGDLFWSSQRAQVAAGIQIATGIGFAAGQGIAGFTAPVIGWRWPFIIVAIPAVLMAFLMVLTVPEPPRGVTEDAIQKHCEVGKGYVYTESINWTKIKRVFTTRSNLCCIGQGLPGSLPWGVILTYLNDYLVQEQRLNESIAATVLIVFGVGGGVGVVGGGYIGQHLYNRRKRMMPLFVGVCVGSAVLPMLWLINAHAWRWPLFCAYFAAFFGGMLASPPGPNARAILLNVNEPETRGIALGAQTVMDDCGRGLGPLFVASLLGMFRRMPRSVAVNIAVLGWWPAGVIFATASLYIVKDEIAMQERLREVAINAPAPPAALRTHSDATHI